MRIPPAQTDGNLVLYNASVHNSGGGGALFSSSTCCGTSTYALKMLTVRPCHHARLHGRIAVHACLRYSGGALCKEDIG